MEIVRSAQVESEIPIFDGSKTEVNIFERPSRILVFDNDQRSEHDTCHTITNCLTGPLFDLSYCRSTVELQDLMRRARLTERPYDLIMWGLNSPFEEGLAVLKTVTHEARMTNANVRIVLLAPQEALAFAPLIKGMQVEAFILKPLHAHDIRSGVERALCRPRETVRFGNLFAPMASLPEIPMVYEDGRDLGLITASAEMKKVVSIIRKVGPSNVNVLITGESGSGKEMVANAIHRVSDRAKKPFIAINCAAIPRDLLESELFGHAKGAFTGATSTRRGLFEEAHEGTILLDEIGDLPLSLQAKILRLLQTKQVKPLGQNVTREVDVRIISATHKNLKTLIQKGEFREDLYYRLNVMPILLPPLRDRKDDILPLTEYFLRRFAERRHGPAPELTKKAHAKLLNLPWKGNVRELENVIERAIVMSDGISISENEILCEELEPQRASAEDLFNAGLSLKDIEREYIKYVLNRVGNRKEAATRILGIDRKTLYRKEKTYGIRRPDEMN